MGRTIYVVTHPEATHHIDGVVGGWHDSDLTPRGLRDAEAIAQTLGHLLSGLRTEVISSDLRRAARTADAIATTLGTDAVLDPRLREKSYGVAEGRPQSWLDARFITPPAIGDRLSHDEGLPGAETKADFAARIYAAMDEIFTRPAEHQVIVSHGFALTYVITAWIKVPLTDLGYASFPAKPASITTLVEDDRFHNRQVVTLADTGHLPPMTVK